MAFVLGCLMVAAPLQAAPKSDLWERWVSHDPDSTIAVDHNPWEILLAKYVYPHEDGINRVAYDAVHLIDQKALDQYIASLSAVKVSTLNRNEQQAYWINLYNALTVQVILDKYPVPSIRNIDISPGFFSDGPWDKALVQIEGEDITLNDIEHRILRPIWKDPRIHYALNCASLGCPNQTGKAYNASTSDQMLDQAAREFINHPRAVGLHGGRLYASSIYDWYIEDFGNSEQGVLEHLRQYAKPELINTLSEFTSIYGYGYDWELNSVIPSIAERIRKRGS